MQVKFRGKRVDGGGWVEGDLMWHKRFIELKPYIKSTQTGQMEWIEVEPSSIGMFTGLTDKNGKEIFGAVGDSGGDIVFWKDSCENPNHWRYAKVDYYTPRATFCFTIVKCGTREIGYQFGAEHSFGGYDELEIIGNAFDNPELLEK